MNANLVKAANEVVPSQQILVNMLSRRVRQLVLGHRPLVEHPVGLREADIALMEIISGKLTYESTFGEKAAALAAAAAATATATATAVVVPFPATGKASKKAA